MSVIPVIFQGGMLMGHKAEHRQGKPPMVSFINIDYRKTPNISCTQPRNLNVSHIALQLPLPNPLKPGV